jgi:hypothetical protein
VLARIPLKRGRLLTISEKKIGTVTVDIGFGDPDQGCTRVLQITDSISYKENAMAKQAFFTCITIAVQT